uniref:STAS domain-containing protein n=1 Tax=Panagrellus redivivus TaxID=6233 RepID=A0A7E4W0L9_PANRE
MTEIRIVRDVLNQDDFEKQYEYYAFRESMSSRFRREIQKRTRKWSILNLITTLMPVLTWLPKYQLSYIMNDAVAGATIAILNIPQAMAYAALSGVPAVVGLYTSFFPPLLYMLFGTSRHISLGMFAVIALMTGTVESRLRSTDTHEHAIPSGTALADMESVQIITTLTLAIGLVLAVMALLQVHFVSAYLSDQLIAGFTSGAVFHVLWSQIPKIFAVKLPREHGIFKLIKIAYHFLGQLHNTNITSLIVSVACIVFLHLSKSYLNPIAAKYCPLPVPFELIVVIITTVLSNVLDFHGKHNVAVVGEIPTGFPAPHMPKWDRFNEVLPDAIIIAIVIYAVSFSVAKLFARKHQYPLNAAQEIRAISLTQILASFMSCHPACASLSRSAINSQLGTHTQVSAIVSSSIIFALFMWIGPLVEKLPLCVLASIIVVALKPMFMQLKDLPKLYRTSKVDFLIFLVSFLGTVLWDVSQGLTIALAFTLLTVIARIQYPKTLQVAEVSDTELYRDSRKFIHACENPAVVTFRFEAPLLFINVDVFKAQVTRIRNCDSSRSFFVVDCTAMPTIDKMGVDALIEASEDLRQRDIRCLIAGANEEVLSMLMACGAHAFIPRNSCFASVHDAVVYANSECRVGVETV